MCLLINVTFPQQLAITDNTVYKGPWQQPEDCAPQTPLWGAVFTRRWHDAPGVMQGSAPACLVTTTQWLATICFDLFAILTSDLTTQSTNFSFFFKFTILERKQNCTGEKNGIKQSSLHPGVAFFF